jgi:hypothetical protein
MDSDDVRERGGEREREREGGREGGRKRVVCVFVRAHVRACVHVYDTITLLHLITPLHTPRIVTTHSHSHIGPVSSVRRAPHVRTLTVCLCVYLCVRACTCVLDG